MIETALVMPVVLFLTFGFINLCLILFGMGGANFASRVALRYACLHSSQSYSPTTQQDLNNIVGAFILKYPSNTHSISIAYPAGANVVGYPLAVTVNVSFPFSILGSSYPAISYTSTGQGIIQN